MIYIPWSFYQPNNWTNQWYAVVPRLPIENRTYPGLMNCSTGSRRWSSTARTNPSWATSCWGSRPPASSATQSSTSSPEVSDFTQISGTSWSWPSAGSPLFRLGSCSWSGSTCRAPPLPSIVNGAWRKELVRWTGESFSVMKQTPPSPDYAGSKE